MNRFKILFISSLIFTLLTSKSAICQSVKTDRGNVEFVGLDNWTVDQLTDTLKAIAPDQSLHFCVAILKQELGFADANVTHFLSDAGMHSVVTLVEPSDSNLVRYIPLPKDTLTIPDSWQALVDSIKSNQRAFDTSFQLYDLVLKEKTDSAYVKIGQRSINKAYAKKIWSSLRKLNDPTDKMRAIWHLNNDGNRYHRIAAAAILTNFGKDDATWWNLVHALRSEDFHTVFASMFALTELTQSGTYSVDWSPAAQDIKYLLQGTNPLAFEASMELLTRTKIAPHLAPIIFSGSSNLVLSYSKLNYKPASQTAKSFLRQISGRNFSTSEKWKSWLKQF